MAQSPPTTPMPPREGPRPLPVHLACAMMMWLSSPAALQLARTGLLPWRPALATAAQNLNPALENASPDGLALALGAEARARLEAMLDGIERYRTHPYRRVLDEPPEIWREGSSRLLDYGATHPEAANGAPVLFVPSLVNRGYVLDLSARRSLLRNLAGRGLRPMLLEWGAPGADEKGFSFTDYVATRLEHALDAGLGLGTGPVPVVGYCMGGQLALALSLRRPKDIARLALLATPWDYHANPKPVIEGLEGIAGPLAFAIDQMGELPVDLDSDPSGRSRSRSGAHQVPQLRGA